MNYRLFDKNNKELHYRDLQDKAFWCQDGEKVEEAFIRLFGEQLGLAMNPEKKNNPYAPDLVKVSNGTLADLKFQSTPFFKAESLYNMDPTYTVVFNLKDRQRYEQLYPNLEIYYWINWRALKFQSGELQINVKELSGIWKVKFKEFAEYLNSCPLHFYKQRVNDIQGNAKSSYVCNLNNDIFYD